MNTTSNTDLRPSSVLVIGAGFAGLGTAIRLLQSGIQDFVILERGDEVGGTWRDNTYPGAACDIPSLLYSFSFAQNPAWSHAYSGSDEILTYIRHLVEKFELRRFIRFGTDVTGLAFDETEGTWTVDSTHEQFRARAVVVSSGPLANASLPEMRGIETFAGHKIHSARWDHDYDLRGKRVAVIGTGASAIQIIPELVEQAEQVTVYQRTPGWVLPRSNYRNPTWIKTLFGQLPMTQSVARSALFWGHESMALGMVWSSPLTTVIERVAAAHLRAQVKDPWLRRQLTPEFRAGCKRMLVSSDYYPALQRENCKLITWPIATLSPDGIRTADGIERRFDCIVFATGFDVNKQGTPFPIRGLDGRVLAAEWTRGAQAYKSVSVAGYPNLFLTFGPNSGPGHNSALVYMESQIDYIVGAVHNIVDEDLLTLDVRADSQRQYNAAIQQRLGSTTWNTGCHSWYLTEDGFNSSMFPGFATQYARQLSRLEASDYEFVARERATRRPAVDVEPAAPDNERSRPPKRRVHRRGGVQHSGVRIPSR